MEIPYAVYENARRLIVCAPGECRAERPCMGAALWIIHQYEQQQRAGAVERMKQDQKQTEEVQDYAPSWEAPAAPQPDWSAA